MLVVIVIIRFILLQLNLDYIHHCRAEFTKYYVQPSLGESGVGGAMAVYGVFDAIVSRGTQIIDFLYAILPHCINYFIRAFALVYS